MPNNPLQPQLPEDVWLDSLNKQISGSAVIATIGDKVLLVKANYKSYWTFPGGIVDAGETPLQAAQREFQEEVGLKVNLRQSDFTLLEVTRKLQYIIYHFMFKIRLPAELVTKIKLQTEEIEAYQVLNREQILSGDYGQMSYTVLAWARGETGYIESL